MFVEKDFKLLGEVFSMARVQTVNAQPNNRQALENLMNFEAIFKGKLGEVNTQLGTEIPAEPIVDGAPVDTHEDKINITIRVGIGLPFLFN